MKFLVLLFSDDNEFQERKLFPGADGLKSAHERAKEWAAALELEGAQKETLELQGSDWTSGRLMEGIASSAKDKGADFVVFAHSSAAFLDLPLSKKLIQDHVEFKAEYTFADGYPAGFAPEIIDSGAAAIMAELCKGASLEAARKPVSKDSVFDIIKGDVNSFEIETEIAGEDYRLLRMDFLCSSNINALAAGSLAKKLAADGKQSLLELDKEKIGDENVLAICEAAKSEVSVLKTVPAFYNVQIEGRVYAKNSFSPYKAREERMNFESFAALVKKIKEFSGDAMVSLSLFGEAALHPDFDKFALAALDKGLGVFAEIDGGLLPQFIRGGVFKSLVDSVPKEKRDRLCFAVCLDAASQTVFEEFHQGSLEEAAAAVRELSAAFPQTYPQFVRVQKNEEELEAFFRFWSDKNSPSGGKIIVQKYDHFCGLLPQEKTADLSPIERGPCWHLRRDMDILLDGSVPLCRDLFLEKPLGNVFNDGLADVWSKKDSFLAEHLKNEYGNSCGNCDEWYVFNF